MLGQTSTNASRETLNSITQPVKASLTISHTRNVIEDAVSSAFGISREELRAPTRSRAEAAFARQVAMYLAHVACGLSFTEIGQLFGRDRTTVAHGCSLVEDMRDDPVLDLRLTVLEKVVQGQVVSNGR